MNYMLIISISTYPSRRKATQVHSLRKGVQSKLKFDYSFTEAHGVQAIRLRVMPQGISAEGGPATAQGDATHGRAGDAEQ